MQDIAGIEAVSATLNPALPPQPALNEWQFGGDADSEMLKATGGEPVALLTFPDRLR